jgi:undecaprenyl-diphosphatase
MVQYIILGIIQGLTEFLPVSSSAHLIIGQKLLGITDPALLISVVLHLGTVLALIIFFFKYILEALVNPRTLLLILCVTVITGVVGILGKEYFETLFQSTRMAALSLIVTGVILLATAGFNYSRRQDIGFLDAIILGFTQAIAIIPGISRSGITISTLIFRRIDRQIAFRFSFLAAIPVILGAGLLELKDLHGAAQLNAGHLAVGFIFSLLSGLFALWMLRFILAKAKFHYFGYYCIVVAVLTLIFLK